MTPIEISKHLSKISYTLINRDEYIFVKKYLEELRLTVEASVVGMSVLSLNQVMMGAGRDPRVVHVRSKKSPALTVLPFPLTAMLTDSGFTVKQFPKLELYLNLIRTRVGGTLCPPCSFILFKNRRTYFFGLIFVDIN